MIDKETEKDFGQWLESIVLVDAENKPLPVVLTADESSDPEDDRGEAE